MNLVNYLYSKLWRILPSSFFNPQSGDLTLEGIALSKRPQLSDEELVKFAVFTDARFNMSHLFEKLIPFLPENFEVVEEPNGQNCFMYCLDILKQRKKFGRKEFDQELEKRGYEYLDYSSDSVEIGDIIVYSTPGFIDSIRQHAGIYVGNERVQSRWGPNSPLIEHPLKEVIPCYWNKDDNYLTIEKRNGQK